MKTVNNDFVKFAMLRACDMFGGNDNVFNNASFATAFADICGIKNKLDGRYVTAILCGRDDVKMLDGGCHYKLNKGI